MAVPAVALGSNHAEATTSFLNSGRNGRSLLLIKSKPIFRFANKNRLKKFLSRLPHSPLSPFLHIFKVPYHLKVLH